MNALIIVIAVSMLTARTYAFSLTKNPMYLDSWKGPSPEWYSESMVEHSSILIKTFHKIRGQELVPLSLVDDDPVEASKRLFMKDDVMVLSHGIQGDPEGPILNYGNYKTLQQWKASWEQLTTMPSRYTAGPQDRSEREKFLQQILETGYSEGYSGIRVAVDGTKFLLTNATVWNVEWEGRRIGQAAALFSWEPLDSTS